MTPAAAPARFIRPTEVATRLGDAGRSGKSSLDNAHTATTELSVVSGSCGRPALRIPAAMSRRVNVTSFGAVGPTSRLESEPGFVAESASPARTSKSAVGGVEDPEEAVVDGSPSGGSVRERNPQQNPIRESRFRLAPAPVPLPSTRASSTSKSVSSSHAGGSHLRKVFRAKSNVATKSAASAVTNPSVARNGLIRAPFVSSWKTAIVNALTHKSTPSPICMPCTTARGTMRLNVSIKPVTPRPKTAAETNTPAATI
mmetsp:Transcript_3362/g.14126  ORF Transcript_3362/g.14126 Transcript_3362/m.14126 type:complete len:257 (+) Transcript_3362:732-1502(+)